MPHSVTDGPLVRVVPGRPIGAALYRWRSAPEPTARRRFRRGSVRRLPGPFTVVAAPVSTNHRVSLPTCDGYSSRSQPVLRDVAGSMARGSDSVKRSAWRRWWPRLEPGAANHRKPRI